MRTTLTLDPDVARLVQEAVQEQRRTMKDVVNDALRFALGATHEHQRYEDEVHRSRLLPGFDLARLHSLADELDDADRLTTLGVSP